MPQPGKIIAGPATPQAAAYPVQAPGPAHRLALQPARKLVFPRALGTVARLFRAYLRVRPRLAASIDELFEARRLPAQKSESSRGLAFLGLRTGLYIAGCEAR